uniref:Uncharacterized protein n=1 Tax=Rhizophora mucronata TaxID=61149 RepID=A0A2P2N7J1_RHIMU
MEWTGVKWILSFFCCRHTLRETKLVCELFISLFGINVSLL